MKTAAVVALLTAAAIGGIARQTWLALNPRTVVPQAVQAAAKAKPLQSQIQAQIGQSPWIDSTVDPAVSGHARGSGQFYPGPTDPNRRRLP